MFAPILVAKVTNEPAGPEDPLAVIYNMKRVVGRKGVCKFMLVKIGV